MKTTSKMKATKKMNKTWKMMMTSKLKVTLKKFAPPTLKKILPDFSTSQLDSHTTTDVKQEMLSGVQTGNGIPHY